MKKSLLFGCAVLAALVMFAACGGNGDPTSPPVAPPSATPTPAPPAPITAESFDLPVTAGDTAFKVVATGGTLESGLKVFIKDDGTAITITKAATLTDYVEAAGNGLTVTQAGQVIVVTDLTAATTSGDDKTLVSGGTIPVTLAADAQTSQVSSIDGLSKVPQPLGDNTYTVKAPGSNGAQEVTINGSVITVESDTLDPDIDEDVVGILLPALQVLVADDTFDITTGALDAIELNAAPADIATFNSILQLGVPEVTLADAFTIAANEVLTIPAGVELILNSVAITLTNDADDPAKIIFAGAGATLTAGGSAGTVSSAAGVLAADNSTDQDVIPVSSFTDLTISGVDNGLDSITYTSGTDPWITGPKSASGSAATLSASTDCQ
jgi:hypothetical protein